MRATMSETGQLRIHPESSTEEYALRKWWADFKPHGGSVLAVSLPSTGAEWVQESFMSQFGEQDAEPES